MRIVGEWQVCDDGITRPTIQANVLSADGGYHADKFLIDPARTVPSSVLTS